MKLEADEVMKDKDMDDMHKFWCAGQNRHHTKLCTVWYENEDERREALANGKPPPPPKGDAEPELKEMFNKAIEAIRANGTYEQIQSKYFDFDVYGG